MSWGSFPHLSETFTDVIYSSPYLSLFPLLSHSVTDTGITAAQSQITSSQERSMERTEPPQTDTQRHRLMFPEITFINASARWMWFSLIESSNNWNVWKVHSCERNIYRVLVTCLGLQIIKHTPNIFCNIQCINRKWCLFIQVEVAETLCMF